MVDPRKWADSVEQEREEVVNQKAQAEAAFIARREIFNQGAPKLWPAVREAFNRFCNAYNEKRDVLYCADVGSRTFIVKRKDLPNVVMTVEGIAVHRLKVNSKIYTPEVFDNGHGSVSYVSQGAPITPDEIAAEALSAIAKI